MKNNDDKLKMIAAQALADKYGFCPAYERVKLLESFNEEYILFRVGEHEYRFDDGVLTNMEDRKKSDEDIVFTFQMFLEVRKDKDIAEKTAKALTKRCNEFRFENRRLKDANIRLTESCDQMKEERNEYIKLWLSTKEERDELQKRIYQCDKEPAEE